MTDWHLTLTGGPRNADRITTSDLLPFMVFTTGNPDGTTQDHYYGPTSVDTEALTAVYEPVDGPESALAMVWEQGYDAGVADLRDKNLERIAKNPYRRMA